MKRSISAKMLLPALFFLWYGNIYDIHITTINGTDKSLNDFAGKKLLIVVLPLTQNPFDSLLLRKIDSVSRQYSDRLSVIGVVSIDDGYNPASLDALKAYYNSMMAGPVTITKPMRVRKGNGTLQSNLFAWLTNKDKNGHFNIDVSGPGHAFFINGQGQLYGVFAGATGFNRKVLLRMLQ